jgi:hypothetical protein
MRISYRTLSVTAALLLSALAAPTTCASQVTVGVSEHGARAVTHTVPIAVGSTSTLDLRHERYDAVGGCARAGGDIVRAKGEGRTGLIVEVTSQSVTDGAMGTAVHVYSADLVKLLPMRAGACDGQTPALLKWDATASFQLAPGTPQTFAVGDVTVVVTLDVLPRANSNTLSGGFSL